MKQMTHHDAELQMALSAAQIGDAASSFARSGIIRIAEPFSADVAERLHRHLDTEISWGRTFSRGEKDAWDLTPEAIAALDGDKKKAFLTAVHDTARDGFQFLFDSLIVSDDADTRADRGLLIDRVVDALNHRGSLDAFRAITGAPDICRVNGQATRYLPGHFLTSHDDGIAGENRVAAYVINLTKGWRTDWGGLLQFQTGSGDVPLALKPGFNTIHLFRVPQLHSVTYVAPFAALPRYAVTGWLCR
jgi:SM-20-related protein